MLCLGTNDDILPNTTAWTKDRVDIKLYRCNILQVVLVAITSVLQYVKLLSAEDFTAGLCEEIQKHGELSCMHTLYIFQLKQVSSVINPAFNVTACW